MNVFLAAYSSNFRPCTQGTSRKNFHADDGRSPKLVRCRSCSQLSLIRISRSPIYIELDLDQTKKYRADDLRHCAVELDGYPLICAVESLSSAEMQRANVTT